MLGIDATNPRATHVADLATADELRDDAFDWFVLTQTLRLIYLSSADSRVFSVMAWLQDV